MTDIDCPRAKTWMTPCIGRDKNTALADDGVCVGCGVDPLSLIRDLAERYPPAVEALSITDPDEAAKRFTALVAAYVEDKP